MILYVLVRHIFDNSLEAENNNISLLGYNLIRAGYPSNTRRDGVFVSYEESLAVTVVDIRYLSKCVACEVTIQNKRCYIAKKEIFCEIRERLLSIFVKELHRRNSGF